MKALLNILSLTTGQPKNETRDRRDGIFGRKSVMTECRRMSATALAAAAGCVLAFSAIVFAVRPALAGAAEKPDLIVAPNGNDGWSGTLDAPNAEKSDGPLATVQRAIERIAQLRAAQPDRKTPWIIAVRGGNYWLDRPIVVRPEHSGTADAPLVIRAFPDERPVLSGGRPVSGWQVIDGRWETARMDPQLGSWPITQLFVADQRCFRPQLPKQGYYKVAKELPPTAERANKGFDQFGYSGDDIRADWANLANVEIVVFHQWSASRLPIARVVAEENRVELAGHTNGTAQWTKFGQGHRYLVVNVKEALSEPGQFYFDLPTGKLIYLPRPGETPEKTLVVAPRLEQLLVLAGDAAGQRYVQHIEFRGLTFAHSQWTTPPTGQSIPQAEINLDSAIAAIAARNIVFDTCAIRHTGAYAMAFGNGSRHNRIENCEMFDLGGGGIKIGNVGGGPWGHTLRVPNEGEGLTSHHTVRNCTIAHGGRLHNAAVGVWIGQSPHNVIEHNDIYDFYYTGISVGWTWGYGPSQAHHNTIAFNHVYNIGQGVLSDMGGIYTLGVQPGTVVKNNVFHDIQAFSYGGWGLYTDEGSTDIVMENNLVYRTKTGGFHQHYGKENIIRNNIFAFSKEHQIQRTRTEPHRSFVFERNIVYWDNDSPLLGSNWRDDGFLCDHNVYWNAAGKPVVFPGGLTIEQWREKRKQDLHSIIADPGFVDPAQGNFRLKPDSPALKVGFVPFDYSKAGRTTKPILTAHLPPVPAAFE